MNQNPIQQMFFPSPDQVEKFKRMHNKQIKEMFRGKINRNFLIEMFYGVFEELCRTNEVSKIFNIGLDQQSIIKADHDSIDYEICRYIVGAHRSNTIFLSETELSNIQKNNEYKKKLKNDVLVNIRLRNYAGYYFRKKQIIAGDEFIFFNLPHDLYALCINANLNLNKKCDYRMFYVAIFNKALAALSLVENNFVDVAYPSCRAVIELYLKLLILKYNPNVLKDYDRFENYDIHRNVCTLEWADDFLNEYENKKYPGQKGEYLHFGWVDHIEDYSKLVTGKYKYSISGLSQYISKKHPAVSKYYMELSNFYQICNTYAHGNRTKCIYPLNDYFMVCEMLGSIIPHVYKMLCEDIDIDEKIEGFDVLQKAEEDLKILCEQNKKKTTAEFNEYYKKYGMLLNSD